MTDPWAALRHELEVVLGSLEGKVVVLGSGAMQLRGINRRIADIDLFATREAWDALEATDNWSVAPDLDPPPMLQGWSAAAHVPVHCWYETYTRFIDNDSSPATTFARATVVNGWPVMDLTQLMEWKLEANRPKDRDDCALIAAYLERFDA